MELRSVRHDKAFAFGRAENTLFQACPLCERIVYLWQCRPWSRKNGTVILIFCLFLIPEKKGNREIKREIIYLKGSITEEDIDAPEIDLKVVFGDDWKKSSQTYYRNILQEGKQIWQKI